MVEGYLRSIKGKRKLSNPLIEISTLFNFETAYTKLVLAEIKKEEYAKRPKRYFNKNASPPLARNIKIENPVKQDKMNLKDAKPLDGNIIECKGDNKMKPVDQRSHRSVFEE